MARIGSVRERVHQPFYDSLMAGWGHDTGLAGFDLQRLALIGEPLGTDPLVRCTHAPGVSDADDACPRCQIDEMFTNVRRTGGILSTGQVSRLVLAAVDSPLVTCQHAEDQQDHCSLCLARAEVAAQALARQAKEETP